MSDTYTSRYTGEQIDEGIEGGLNAVPKSRTINGKALTDDIELTAADVGAIGSWEDIQSPDVEIVQSMFADLGLTVVDGKLCAKVIRN